MIDNLFGFPLEPPQPQGVVDRIAPVAARLVAKMNSRRILVRKFEMKDGTLTLHPRDTEKYGSVCAVLKKEEF